MAGRRPALRLRRASAVQQFVQLAVQLFETPHQLPVLQFPDGRLFSPDSECASGFEDALVDFVEAGEALAVENREHLGPA
jgi:hypothetical protein